MELEAIKAAIKVRYNKDMREHYQRDLMKYYHRDSQAVRLGALTTQLSKDLDMPIKKLRYHLNKFEAKGQLLKSPTAGGISRWWYPGLLEELKKEESCE